MINGSENNYKTYQGQELTEDLGLNLHEWKYRFSDPAIGRFISIDPLAVDYTYNSTYAFQENKLGLGIELEGAELLERAKNGIRQFFKGTGNLIHNETFGEAQRQMTIANNDSENIKQIQQEGLSNKAQALGDMGEGATETMKGSVQAVGTSLEYTGDGLTIAGVATAFPPLIAAGETIGTVGTGINTAVDISDGKPFDQIALEKGTTIILGKLGSSATNSIRKSAGPEALKRGETVISETIVKVQEIVSDKVINKEMINQSQPIKYNKKD